MDIEGIVDRAVALMRHKPTCPYCRAPDAWLFDNTKPTWCCRECNRFFVSKPAPETRQ